MAHNVPKQYDDFGSSVPMEIWTMILRYLSLDARLRVRLLSTQMRDIATPACFETLAFELSTPEISRLHKISTDAKLCTQVKVLKLRRARGLRNLQDFLTWERSISQPGDPGADSFDERCWAEDAEEAHREEIEDLMSYHDWSLLPHSEKEELYSAYEADRKSYQDQSRELTLQPYLRTLDCVRTVQPKPAMDATQIEELSPVQRFDKAIANFSNLHTVKCEPGFLHDNTWASRWRRLRFSYVALLSLTDYQEDEDLEALQLSYTLRALGWAKHHLRLQSIKMYVGGPAFWGIDNLQSLWDGKGHRQIRENRRLFGNVVEAREYQDSENSLGKDDCLRQLIIMEQSFNKLVRLDCSISEEEEDGGLCTVARPFFQFLCCAENLQELRLAFGRLVDGSLQTEYERRDNGDGPAELLALLEEHRPWSKIRTLTLEIVVKEVSIVSFLSSLSSSLRHLTLTHVTLPPGEGSWESVLFRIPNMLNLHSLRLSELCDHITTKRVLFDHTSDIWTGRRSCYDDYESTTIKELLCRERPVLDAASFLQGHDHACPHQS
ncbi:unnamed protein product [Periconia digitata]|uniref:F-box domain-containing protein n=1 Tax=Periconia digitata TaxID=1303443 RepID=A0A9W4U290_9PLEO|nr:unnamed protein product [Periconia digitata]